MQGTNMTSNLKKIVSVALSVLLICLSVPFAFAEGFAGEGTPEQPYAIADAADMAFLAESVAQGESFAGKYFMLIADIDFDYENTPVGTEDAPFSGNFDGAGFAFLNPAAGTDFCGIFGSVKNAVITGVTVRDFSFSGEDYVAAVVGKAVDSEIRNCTAESGYVYGFGSYTGGIVGKAEGGRIDNCFVSADIVNYTEFAGGIAGASTAPVVSCKTEGTVSAGSTVGGIVGFAGAPVTDCVNNTAVSASYAVAGGIAGHAESDISRCFNKNTADGFGRVGGVVGVNIGGKVAECGSVGDVSSEDAFCAGVAAYSEGGSVSDCYNAGFVRSSDKYSAGIIAYIDETEVSRCYNAGGLSAAAGQIAGIGAVVYGKVKDCVTVESDYGTFCTAVGSFAENCEAVTEQALKDEETFSAWDLENTWEINGYHSYEYPVLRNIEYHTLTLLDTVEPTCTEKGYSEYFCSVCVASFVYDIVDALGHDFSVIDSKAATCTEDGYADYECTRCTATKSETLKATGHTDANNDNRCDTCKAVIDQSKVEKSFFEKIADFFNKIVNWFRNLFKK